MQRDKGVNRQSGSAKRKTNECEENTEPTENDICHVCNLKEPPGLKTSDENVSWICCDGCLTWNHMVCVGVVATQEYEQWLCPNCVECWL